MPITNMYVCCYNAHRKYTVTVPTTKIMLQLLPQICCYNANHKYAVTMSTTNKILLCHQPFTHTYSLLQRNEKFFFIGTNNTLLQRLHQTWCCNKNNRDMSLQCLPTAAKASQKHAFTMLPLQ